MSAQQSKDCIILMLFVRDGSDSDIYYDCPSYPCKDTYTEEKYPCA